MLQNLLIKLLGKDIGSTVVGLVGTAAVIYATGGAASPEAAVIAALPAVIGRLTNEGIVNPQKVPDVVAKVIPTEAQMAKPITGALGKAIDKANEEKK